MTKNSIKLFLRLVLGLMIVWMAFGCAKTYHSRVQKTTIMEYGEYHFEDTLRGYFEVKGDTFRYSSIENICNAANLFSKGDPIIQSSYIIGNINQVKDSVRLNRSTFDINLKSGEELLYLTFVYPPVFTSSQTFYVRHSNYSQEYGSKKSWRIFYFSIGKARPDSIVSRYMGETYFLYD